MFVASNSATLFGIDGVAVRVETQLSKGLPSFTIVGHIDSICREARDRVRAAVLSSSLNWPLSRITVNLAPTRVKKVGAGLDLAIAIGVLGASGQVETGQLDKVAFLGELGLDGSIRATNGVLARVESLDVESVIVCSKNSCEASLANKGTIYCADALLDVVEFLNGKRLLQVPSAISDPFASPDLADIGSVKGQLLAKRAIEVCAAGKHNLLMVGEPGAGKSLLASCIPSILPSLDFDQARLVTKVRSAAGMEVDRLHLDPPFRSPHHSASLAALVGGSYLGAIVPGEVTLASNGVLFLDEITEFPASVLDALRQPLEDRTVRISRSGQFVTMPADPILVGACNPCACGKGFSKANNCQCSDSQRQRYLRRISGPLLDRFDLRIIVEPIASEELFTFELSENSTNIRTRVNNARLRYQLRSETQQSSMGGQIQSSWNDLTQACRDLISDQVDAGRLSARGATSVRRVAQTIADLEDKEEITPEDVWEALALRAEIDASRFGAR